MSRLDELIALRDDLDREIALERVTQARHRGLMVRVSTALTRGSWDNRVFAATCAYFEVDGDDVLAPTRGTPKVLHARYVAMWLMRQAGRSYPEVGRQMERDHSTVIKACRHVNGRQDLQTAAAEIYTALTGEDLRESA